MHPAWSSPIAMVPNLTLNTSLLNGTNLRNTSERAIIPFPTVSTHFTLHYNFFLQGRVCQANETERKCEVISFIN
jgi:hypothetical protein